MFFNELMNKSSFSRITQPQLKIPFYKKYWDIDYVFLGIFEEPFLPPNLRVTVIQLLQWLYKPSSLLVSLYDGLQSR